MERGSGCLPGNGRHDLYSYGGGCVSTHGNLGGVDGGLPDDPYGGGSDISCSSEFGR